MRTILFAFVTVFICFVQARDPVIYGPKNPSDPPQLPIGVVKKALVIGKLF